MTMQIIYQDNHYIAINKPAGLLVHRSPMDRHETRFALQILREQIGQRVYPVHRLDKPTSGVLLFALDKSAAHSLITAFAEQRVRKTYLAVVRGYTPASDLIDYPLANEVNRMGQVRMCADRVPAVTEYFRLGRAELPVAVGRYTTSRYSLIEVRPHTGRRHQIRRHMKHVLHPIVGDVKHGEGRHNRFFRTAFNCHRLLLSAVELSFAHPYTQTTTRLSAPLDAVFTGVIRRLGWLEVLPAAWCSESLLHEVNADHPDDAPHDAAGP